MKGTAAGSPLPRRVGDAVPLLPAGWRLPADREANAPPEARGIGRDGVRLLVSDLGRDSLVHTEFRNIGGFLSPSDLLVINTSATRAAAVPAHLAGIDAPLRVHFSAHRGGDRWVVEVRHVAPDGVGTSGPFLDGARGDRLELPAGVSVQLITPHGEREPARLWDARFLLPPGMTRPDDFTAYLETYFARYGEPIRYGYARDAWPLWPYYQTVYAEEVGSAEMPSAGRAFTAEGIVQLIVRGIRFAPLVLHTGVSSLEAHEPPYAERFRVPLETARAVNETRDAGGRVIAVGTTVVRALETVAAPNGAVRAGEGWTNLIVTPERGPLRAVNGLLTGLHEPEATHLWMLEALALPHPHGRDHLRRAYAAALDRGYLWHEFGDLHLILGE